MAMKEHPDKGGDEEKFKEIAKAYETLSNPEKKKIYDHYGEEGLKNQGMGFFTSDRYFFNVFWRWQSCWKFDAKKRYYISFKINSRRFI